MADVDNRVVSIEFNNENFERNISQTLASLSKLSDSLKFQGAQKGFEDISSAAGRTNLSGIASAVDNISSKFSAMGAVGFSVIQNLTTSALSFAKQIGSDVLDPILSGGKTRAENIDQAKFAFRGLGIDVTQAMNSSLDAVRGTAFGLDEAAKAAGQLGASGITAGSQMTGVLRGIAGAAAVTGSSFTDIANIFEQSAASGKIRTIDLEQFATRGLNAAAAVAKQLNLTEAQVRAMASNGTLDFKTFADAMDKALGQHATQANETYSGSLANVHAALSRLGAEFFTQHLSDQKDLFNALSPAIDKVGAALQPMINGLLFVGHISTGNISKMLKDLDIKDLTLAGPNFGKGLVDSFGVIEDALNAFKAGFKEIFPASAGSVILSISKGFEELAAHLRFSSQTSTEVKNIFAGLFAVLDIAFAVIKGIISVLIPLAAHLSGVGSSALGFSSSLGVMLVHFDAVLVKGGAIQRFFENLAIKAQTPIRYIKEVTDAIENFFKSLSNSSISTPGEASLGRVDQRFNDLRQVLERLKVIMDEVAPVLGHILGYIVTWFKDLGKNLAGALKPGDFNSAIDALNVGLLGGVVLLLRNFLDNGLKSFDIGGGVFSKIGKAVNELTGALKSMQQELKAKTLEDIAIAVGILTISIVALSLINSEDLTKALKALAAGFAELVGVMKILNDIANGAGDAAKLGLLAIGMNLMATSAVILTGAIVGLSSLSIDQLKRGLEGLTAVLTLMVVTSKAMTGESAGMVAAGVAMVAMATGMTILAGAVKLFSLMSWSDMIKGLGGVALSLGIIAVTMQIMPVASTIAAGLAMIPLATGLTILAGAVKLFSLLTWSELLRGMVGLAASLVILAVAMSAMPLTLPITAAGLLLVGVALTVVAGAVKLMGSMNFETLAKGIGAIALMLIILAAGTTAMTGALPGAIALGVVSVALHILAGVLEQLGKMKITEILTALAAMAGVFVVIGLAALVMAPIIPVLFALGAAMALLGAGFVLFGAGAFLVGEAFKAMSEAGVEGAKALVASLKVIITAIPEIVAALIASLGKVQTDLLQALPLVLRLLTAVFSQVLDTIIQLAPKLAVALTVVITHLLILLRSKFPDLISTAVEMILVILDALDKNIGQIAKAGLNIVIKLIESISSGIPRLVGAAADLIIAFLNSLADHTVDIVTAGINVVIHLVEGIANNLFKLQTAANDLLIAFINAVAQGNLQLITAGANIIISFVTGIANNIQKVVDKGVDVILAFLNGISGDSIKLANGASDTLINFLNALATVIRTKTPEIEAAGLNVASAIVDGIVNGLSAPDIVNRLLTSVKNLADKAYHGFMDFIQAKSPSKLFAQAGGFIGQGIALGLDQDVAAENSAVAHAERIVQAFSDTLKKMPDTLAEVGEINPVITPVLDLTKVKVAAQGITALITPAKITPDVSLNQARVISSTAEIASTKTPEIAPAATSDIKFEQNIYSPGALSTNDIYRNTKSQIALAKEELKIK